MKKSIKMMMAFAASVLTLVACNKEEKEITIQGEKETFTVNFTASSDEFTKVYFGDKTEEGKYPVYWNGGERVAVIAIPVDADNNFMVDGVQAFMGENAPVAEAINEGRNARFSVNVEKNEDAASWIFSARCPTENFFTYGVAASGLPFLTYAIPTVQTPLSSAPDPSAMYLSSFSAAQEADGLVNVDFKFRHGMVNYLKMSLKNLDESATIKEVRLALEPNDSGIEGNAFGDFYYEFEYIPEELRATGHITGGVNEATIKTSSRDDIWVVMNVGCQIRGKDMTVTVVTDKGDYVKTINFGSYSLSSLGGQVGSFGINFAGIEPEVIEDKYVKVTSDLYDWRGDYLIAYSSTVFMDGSLAGGKEGVGKSEGSVDPVGHISSDGREIDAEWGDEHYVIIEAIDNDDLANGYVIKTHSTTTPYFYQTANSNGMECTDNKSTAANYPIEITFNTEDDIDIALGGNAKGAILHYNNAGTGKMFRFYKNGGQQNIYLYKRTSPVPIAAVPVSSVSLDKETLSIAKDNTVTLTATITPDNATNKNLTWSSDDETVATVENGQVTAVAEGTATITVTTEDGGKTATCEVTVISVPVYESLSELIEHEPTGSPITVTLTEDVIKSIFVTQQGYRNGVFIEVDGKDIEIYCSNVPDDWVAGGTLSGTLENCIWQKFNNTWELCPKDWNELKYSAPAGVILYNITIDNNIENGTVEASKSKAEAGETITLTITPDTGYQLATLTYNGNDITEARSFTMPGEDVIVNAIFTEIPSVDYSGTYAILTKRNEGNYWYMTSDLGTGSTKRFQAVDTGLSELPASVNVTKEKVWTITKSDNGYIISTQDGENIDWTDGNSSALTTTGRILTITASSDDENAVNISFKATETDTRILALNATNGNNYFAFYTGSGRTDLSLVPATITVEPEISSVSPDALTFTATETTAKTVTITGANLTKSNVTLSLNNSDFTAQFGADAYTVDVAPKAANTSTTADKTATLTITVGSVSKTVSLTQSKAGAAEKTVVFDYPSLYPTVTGSASCDVFEDTVGDISVSYVKVSGSNPPKYYANGTNLRIYNKSTMTFTSSAGNITEVDFGQGTTTWASGKMAADTGNLNDSAKKWTGNAKTVTFTVTGSFRFTKICVKYQ